MVWCTAPKNRCSHRRGALPHGSAHRAARAAWFAISACSPSCCESLAAIGRGTCRCRRPRGTGSGKSSASAARMGLRRRSQQGEHYTCKQASEHDSSSLSPMISQSATAAPEAISASISLREKPNSAQHLARMLPQERRGRETFPGVRESLTAARRARAPRARMLELDHHFARQHVRIGRHAAIVLIGSTGHARCVERRDQVFHLHSRSSGS